MTESSVRRRFEMALRAGGIGTWRWDIASGLVDWDASMEELYGFEPGTFDGTYASYASRLHPEDRAVTEAALAEALRARAPVYSVEHRVILPDAQVRWFSSTSQLTLDPDGEPSELIGVAIDVTDRVLAQFDSAAARAAEGRARVAEQVAQRRMGMLARASSLLDAPLDLDATLQRVAELAADEIADWCVVDVMGASGVQHAGVAHRDPAMVTLAREIQARYPSDPANPVRLHLLRSLEPLLVPEVDQETLNASAQDAEHARLLTSLGLHSYLAVPLVASGRAVGTMLLASTRGRPLGSQDVELAMELGRRAGSAIDKSRLYEDLQRTARTLQASLLPPAMPRIEGVCLSAHYRSGTDGIDIGGDYYDVFRTGTQRWWVVLGDVCGKGPKAAALAAAVRYTLRAIAPDTDDPALVVRRLNDVLLAGDWKDRFTTLVLATFATRGPGDSDPDGLRLSMVSAGHPPALVRRANGSVVPVPCSGTLVGILDDLKLETVSVDIGADDMLLLYTDGATEARDAQGRQLGSATLARLFSEAPLGGAGTAAALAEQLILLAPAGLRDDLALLTVSTAPAGSGLPDPAELPRRSA